jgi:hypothetical protein
VGNDEPSPLNALVLGARRTFDTRLNNDASLFVAHNIKKEKKYKERDDSVLLFMTEPLIINGEFNVDNNEDEAL